MPSRILLISANWCRTPDPVFPLGLAYLSAALRNAGYECRWFDALMDSAPLEETLKSWRPQFACISLRNVDDVLVRKRETFFGPAAALAESIRQTIECPIILGGSGFSIFPEQLLDVIGADFGIAGEGETSLVSLIAAIESGNQYQNIPGLVVRQNGKTTRRSAETRPAYQGLILADRPSPIIDHYLSTGGMLNVQTQRGCALHCCYCTYPLIEGPRHRRRSAESLAAEFDEIARLGARYVFIVDSVFNSSPVHVTEICEALLRRKTTLPCGCFLRPQGLSSGLMRLMKRAGLAHIEFGTDSLSDEVLVAYQKGFTVEDIVYSTELARSEDIDCCHFLISGGPGETRATLEQGFKNSRRLKEATILAVVGMRIYPGTDLFERAVAEGRILRHVDLLTPTYYLSPALTEEEVFGQLREFSKGSSNWIVGDPEPDYRSFVARLRKRGVIGPLWSYFSMIQRIGPRQLAAK